MTTKIPGPDLPERNRSEGWTPKGRYELAYTAYPANQRSHYNSHGSFRWGSEGHRYWWLHDSTHSEAPPRLTISDGSGEYPDECDDGLLYVSANGPTIEEGLFRRNPRVSIPLIDRHHNTSSTNGTIAEAFAVAKLMGKPVTIKAVDGTESLAYPLSPSEIFKSAESRADVVEAENIKLKNHIKKLEGGIEELIESLKD